LVEINNHFNESLEDIESKVRSMVQNESVLVNFEKEINLNMEEIVSEMEQEIFYDILGDY
jgi:predicted P-loop ATPase/GTPase